MGTDPTPLATFEFDTDRGKEVFDFLKRTRFELRSLRKVRVWTDRLQIFDINGDYFEIRGLGYPDESITGVLDNINTAYKRELIHTPTEDEFKEFLTGRRYPWAADRVM
ncbi:MAG: hypothetical protein H8E37_07850 [Planctomycetes bacterium]|nr:hypothetical protein [Planctomycetota bacterium]